MRFNKSVYCKDCYVDLFALELVNDLSEALGIKDIERILTTEKKSEDLLNEKSKIL